MEATVKKQLLIKVVDRLDSKQKILSNKLGITSSSRYNYEQIQFEPVLASNVLELQGYPYKIVQDALIGVYLYGRVDIHNSEFSMQGMGRREPQLSRLPIKFLGPFNNEPVDTVLPTDALRGQLLSFRDYQQPGDQNMPPNEEKRRSKGFQSAQFERGLEGQADLLFK